MAELQVLYGCDDVYAPYAGISITSLLENNQSLDKITIFFAGQNISAQNCARLKKLVSAYHRELIFLDTKYAEQQMQKYACKGWNGSLATWLRFFVLDQIPANVQRLLWLDSDTIVTGSLKPLCDFPLGQYPVACACDAICYRQRYRLGLTETEAYYNAGVILFQMSWWHDASRLNQMFRHLNQNVIRYQLNDQDLLNDFFRGQIKRLPIQYNFQGTHLAYTTKDYFSVYPWKQGAYYTESEIEVAKQNPRVMHFFRFLGDYPWQGENNNFHPCKRTYEQWKEQSLWSDTPPALARTNITFKFEKILYRVLPHRAFLKLFSMVSNFGLPHHAMLEEKQK